MPQSEFGWGIQMLLQWDCIISLVETIPELITSSQNSIPDAFGLEGGHVFVYPAFKETVLQSFVEFDLTTMLLPCIDANPKKSFNLAVNEPLVRRALAFLAACCYTAGFTASNTISRGLDLLQLFRAA
ncbi:hypothetical protein FIBSPDRAFT_961422 [Athelia psychrophila]|uniref:Uncharacterized protein n=1 Tax=Athelia psychrophila TaxID=1759441 RepID=A0A166B7L2_9AGAM|nr:hypothetical protein FIBSPDRAFT_961422 [Fibularhizoctonia sp. CBS 109695]